MRFEVHLFGPYRDAVGTATVALEHVSNEPVSAAGLLALIAEREPRLRPLMAGARLAVNSRYAQPDDRVNETDEVALIGLLGGG